MVLMMAINWKSVVLNEGRICPHPMPPRGHLSMSEDMFAKKQLRRGCYRIYLVDRGQKPTEHSPQQQRRWCPSISSAEGKKTCSEVNTSKRNSQAFPKTSNF